MLMPNVIAATGEPIGVFLFGTPTTPILSFDFRTTDPNPINATGGFEFRTDGSIRTWENGVLTDNIQSPINHWFNPNGFVDKEYWILFTLFSGEEADPISPVGQWRSLNTLRQVLSTQSVPAFDGYQREGVYRVDIADDAAGSNILATGYYAYQIDVGP